MLRAFVTFSFLFSSLLYAGYAVVPSDVQYYTASEGNVTVIYSADTQANAQTLLNTSKHLHQSYEKLFDYRMDERLFVGLLSSQNQVANGFVLPVPHNLQMLYMGGALKTDYFTSTSWLKMLMYHETAHNYQLNAKASDVTQAIHKFLGNGAFIAGYFPLLSLPNVTISSQLLEGNAVLNESWQGNGGRLHSGRFKAETLLQAKAGDITPQFLYNERTHEFPFYDRHYIVGGFFQYFLSQKYGLEKTNSYFYKHSESWFWPFQTNKSFEKTFGESYEALVDAFNSSLLVEAEGFHEAEGKLIATSKSFVPFNSNCEKIYFLTSDAQRAPELLELFKKDGKLKRSRGSYLSGKVINIHDTYYTQASGYENATQRSIGLYDKNGHIKEGSASKVVEGYLQNGIEVYIDIPSSFDQPQLYVGDTFYDRVNSSVFIDRDDNIYYFKQEGRVRSLYNNREKVLSYEGYYGVVSDVSRDGKVYFIANSKKGSTLFCYDHGRLYRVSKGDNIVDARLIDEKTALLAVIDQKNYAYLSTSLEIIQERPYADHLFEAQADSLTMTESSKATQVTLESPYEEYTHIKTAGALVQVGATYKNSQLIPTYFVGVSLMDPMLSNAITFFMTQGADEVGRAGVNYINDAHLFEFGGTMYGVYKSANESHYYVYNLNTNEYNTSLTFEKAQRKYGVSAYTKLPFLKRGYDRGSLLLNYYQDYEVNNRAPLSLQLSLSHNERFGQSMYNNYTNGLKLFGAMDRGDASYGGDYKFLHNLPAKFFAGVNFHGVRSAYKKETRSFEQENYTKGVKFSPFTTSSVNDPSSVVMPSLEHTRYVKQVVYGSVDLYKQFDARALFFTFPLSIIQEGIYVKQRHYSVQDYFSSSSWKEQTHYNETTLGVEIETLILNRLPLPLIFEYRYNDNTLEKHRVDFRLGTLSF